MSEIAKTPARRKFTLAELDRLSALGFFGETEHVELIGGELYAMAPKGIRHENVRGEVIDRLTQQLPAGLKLRAELGWRPRDDTYLEPDVLIARGQRNMPLVEPEAVALVVEIAKSSLDHDQGLKADVYAELGVAEYWVIDAVSLETRIHRRPEQRRFRDMADYPATDTLVPLLIPDLESRLADFEFGDVGLGEEEA